MNKQKGEYRKLRGSLRFMLQNVTDGSFDPSTDLLPFEVKNFFLFHSSCLLFFFMSCLFICLKKQQLHPADQYMLVSLTELCNKFAESFNK